MDSQMMDKFGFVYLWYDKKNKQYYVGCHWGYLDDGYVASSRWFLTSYNHRSSDFKRRILKTNITTRKETYVEELRWLNMIKENEIRPNTNNPRYYNLNIRNNEMWHKYDKHIKTVGQKISASKKGKKLGPYSDAHKKAISESRKGWKPTSDHIERMRQTKLTSGFKHSDEWKQANSERLKDQWASGQRKAKEFLSEDHKQAISKKLKGRKLSEEQIAGMKTRNSKTYVIEYMDGTTEVVCGLKQFSQDRNIPYVSLFKASQQGKQIPKYKIKSIGVQTHESCQDSEDDQRCNGYIQEASTL